MYRGQSQNTRFRTPDGYRIPHSYSKFSWKRCFDPNRTNLEGGYSHSQRPPCMQQGSSSRDHYINHCPTMPNDYQPIHQYNGIRTKNFFVNDAPKSLMGYGASYLPKQSSDLGGNIRRISSLQSTASAYNKKRVIDPYYQGNYNSLQNFAQRGRNGVRNGHYVPTKANFTLRSNKYDFNSQHYLPKCNEGQVNGGRSRYQYKPSSREFINPNTMNYNVNHAAYQSKIGNKGIVRRNQPLYGSNMTNYEKSQYQRSQNRGGKLAYQRNSQFQPYYNYHYNMDFPSSYREGRSLENNRPNMVSKGKSTNYNFPSGYSKGKNGHSAMSGRYSFSKNNVLQAHTARPTHEKYFNQDKYQKRYSGYADLSQHQYTDERTKDKRKNIKNNRSAKTSITNQSGLLQNAPKPYYKLNDAIGANRMPHVYVNQNYRKADQQLPNLRYTNMNGRYVAKEAPLFNNEYHCNHEWKQRTLNSTQPFYFNQNKGRYLPENGYQNWGLLPSPGNEQAPYFPPENVNRMASNHFENVQNSNNSQGDSVQEYHVISTQSVHDPYMTETYSVYGKYMQKSDPLIPWNNTDPNAPSMQWNNVDTTAPSMSWNNVDTTASQIPWNNMGPTAQMPWNNMDPTAPQMPWNAVDTTAQQMPWNFSEINTPPMPRGKMGPEANFEISKPNLSSQPTKNKEYEPTQNQQIVEQVNKVPYQITRQKENIKAPDIGDTSTGIFHQNGDKKCEKILSGGILNKIDRAKGAPHSKCQDKVQGKDHQEILLNSVQSLEPTNVENPNENPFSSLMKPHVITISLPLNPTDSEEKAVTTTDTTNYLTNSDYTEFQKSDMPKKFYLCECIENNFQQDQENDHTNLENEESQSKDNKQIIPVHEISYKSCKEKKINSDVNVRNQKLHYDEYNNKNLNCQGNVEDTQTYYKQNQENVDCYEKYMEQYELKNNMTDAGKHQENRPQKMDNRRSFTRNENLIKNTPSHYLALTNNSGLSNARKSFVSDQYKMPSIYYGESCQFDTDGNVPKEAQNSSVRSEMKEEEGPPNPHDRLTKVKYFGESRISKCSDKVFHDINKNEIKSDALAYNKIKPKHTKSYSLSYDNSENERSQTALEINEKITGKEDITFKEDSTLKEDIEQFSSSVVIEAEPETFYKDMKFITMNKNDQNTSSRDDMTFANEICGSFSVNLLVSENTLKAITASDKGNIPGPNKSCKPTTSFASAMGENESSSQDHIRNLGKKDENFTKFQERSINRDCNTHVNDKNKYFVNNDKFEHFKGSVNNSSYMKKCSDNYNEDKHCYENYCSSEKSENLSKTNIYFKDNDNPSREKDKRIGDNDEICQYLKDNSESDKELNINDYHPRNDESMKFKNQLPMLYEDPCEVTYKSKLSIGKRFNKTDKLFEDRKDIDGSFQNSDMQDKHLVDESKEENSTTRSNLTVPMEVPPTAHMSTMRFNKENGQHSNSDENCDTFRQSQIKAFPVKDPCLPEIQKVQYCQTLDSEIVMPKKKWNKPDWSMRSDSFFCNDNGDADREVLRAGNLNLNKDVKNDASNLKASSNSSFSSTAISSLKEKDNSQLSKTNTL